MVQTYGVIFSYLTMQSLWWLEVAFLKFVMLQHSLAF